MQVETILLARVSILTTSCNQNCYISNIFLLLHFIYFTEAVLLARIKIIFMRRAVLGLSIVLSNFAWLNLEVTIFHILTK